MMESLTEKIAAEIGTKWVQLFCRLGLGHKARDRYQIVVEHKDDPQPERGSARDAIRLWQKGLSSDLPETEMMTQLLAAFKTIKGFEDRAKQLAEDCGITLDQPVSAAPSTHPNPSDTSGSGTPHANSDSRSATHKSTLPTTSSPPTPHTERSVDTNSEGGSDMESSNSSTRLPQPTQTEQTLGQSLGAPKPTIQNHTLSEQSQEYSQQLLQTAIDISVTRHKYAILDVCQRLPAQVLSQFAQRLNVPLEKVRMISDDYPIEERYYQLLKYWLSASGTGRTFRELQHVLEMCQQQAVCDVVSRRLQSPGLTLRSPASSR